MSSPQLDENLSAKIKRFYTERVRKPWKYGIDFVLTVIVVILAIVNFNLTTFVVVSFGCVAGFAAVCIFLRAKRGPYHDRQQQPKPKPLGSPRVMKAIDGELPEGEEFVWESRLHPIAVIAWGVRIVLLGVVMIAAMLSFDSHLFLWVFEAAVAASLFMCGYEILSWHRFRFCITNQRVIVVSGIISDEVSTIQIKSINDNKKNQTVPAKILAWLRFIEDEYGSGRLETSGQNQYVDFIGPLPFFGKISSLIDKYRAAGKKKSEDVILLERILETQEKNNGLLTKVCVLLERLLARDNTVDQQAISALDASINRINFDTDLPHGEEEDR